VAGDGIAVIDMGVLPDVGLYLLAGVQPNVKVSLRVDLFDAPKLAVGNVFVPVGRGELHTVAG
jgi:hypothetical protein